MVLLWLFANVGKVEEILSCQMLMFPAAEVALGNILLCFNSCGSGECHIFCWWSRYLKRPQAEYRCAVRKCNKSMIRFSKKMCVSGKLHLGINVVISYELNGSVEHILNVVSLSRNTSKTILCMDWSKKNVIRY